MSTELQITPHELKQRLDKGESIFILDVREPNEFEIANLGGTLIPIRELGTRIGELDASAEIIVLCHHGVRSAHATGFLRQNGFEHAKNLSGGIDQWSLQIDPKIPRY